MQSDTCPRGLILFCVCLLASSGCSSGATTFDVSGKVTFRGQPISQGTINFRSADGKLYGGGLQAEGQFEFQLPPGEYAVRIDAPAALPSGWKEGDPLPNDSRRLLPMKFANFRSSGLVATVTSESDTHRLEFLLE